MIRDSIGFDALREMIRDSGLVHTEIELLERWWIPRGEPGHTYDVRETLFEAADALQPVQIKIGSENGPATKNPLALAEPLRELAEQAAAHGTRVAIETMPFSAIATAPMGAEIVSAANHPAAGSVGGRLARVPRGHHLDELTHRGGARDDLRRRTRRRRR